jgi:hypothetical protein
LFLRGMFVGSSEDTSLPTSRLLCSVLWHMCVLHTLDNFHSALSFVLSFLLWCPHCPLENLMQACLFAPPVTPRKIRPLSLSCVKGQRQSAAIFILYTPKLLWLHAEPLLRQ